MISGDRSILQGKKGAFWYTLEELRKHWERIDVICPFVCHGEPCPPRPTSRTGRTTKLVTHERTYFPNVFFHPCPQGLWYQPFWIKKKGQELIGDHGHNVMTVHEYPPFYNGIGAWWLHKKTGIPYALEIHHIVGCPHAASVVEWVGRLMYRPYFFFLGKKAKRIRTVNDETKAILKRWGVKEEQLRIISSFYLDRDALRPDSSIRKIYDVVFCGRNVPSKGLKELRIATEKIGATLIAIGADQWLETKEDVYRAMQSGKVFVMNSKSEGGPRVLLEAMALGLPVISTRVGVASNVIRDGVNGIFTTGEPDDLGQKIQMLLADEDLRERLGEEACKIGFDREILVKSYAQFLKSLA